MRKTINQLATITLLAIIMLSCVDENNTTGTISGYAYLQDKAGMQWKSSAGITVSIDNTNITAQTDSLGHYSLAGLNKGIYSISFTKSGYAPYKLAGIQFIGKDEYSCNSMYLKQLPTVNSISDVTVRSNSITDSVTISGTITSTESTKCWRMFFSKIRPISSNPDRYDYQVAYSYLETNALPAQFLFDIKKTLLLSFGYKPGQTVYAIIYPECILPTYYKDYKTNKFVYTSLGTPSLTLLVTVPN